MCDSANQTPPGYHQCMFGGSRTRHGCARRPWPLPTTKCRQTGIVHCGSLRNIVRRRTTRMRSFAPGGVGTAAVGGNGRRVSPHGRFRLFLESRSIPLRGSYQQYFLERLAYRAPWRELKCAVCEWRGKPWKIVSRHEKATCRMPYGRRRHARIRDLGLHRRAKEA